MTAPGGTGPAAPVSGGAAGGAVGGGGPGRRRGGTTAGRRRRIRRRRAPSGGGGARAAAGQRAWRGGRAAARGDESPWNISCRAFSCLLNSHYFSPLSLEGSTFSGRNMVSLANPYCPPTLGGLSRWLVLVFWFLACFLRAGALTASHGEVDPYSHLTTSSIRDPRRQIIRVRTCFETSIFLVIHNV